ncbi:ATP-binding protein [Robbsia andropogonis]|uniref:ATP-binding protein n=1 Tax=Robbsia andropogonis TaxID=28092 RepID=UPI00209E081E|nr:winged helix-turn-helix domain-containing protein [Robbsia andropogonis]MCP1120344.1 helix-turn-helix transcriptional regulator [Robbsia andropogonis]MCP1130215.1 helix-turn-helix transcriptional regulator [Robbsia andropogonis]
MVDLGRFQVDLAMRVLRRDHEVVPLGSRAFEILAILAESVGELVTKNQLMEAVWPNTVVEENNLQVHLTAVRKALGQERDLIVTIPGRGYQLRVLPQKQAAPALKVSARRRRLLPARSQLVGRTASTQDLRMLLKQHDVITLTGAGGIGKTSLAIEVVHETIADFHGDLYFVELASAQTRESMLATMIEDCGLCIDSPAPSLSEVAAALGVQRCLLLLDNAEHIADHVAEFVEAVIAENRQLHIIVTSREPLRISSECVYRVEALSVPSSTCTDADVFASDAVALFLMRSNLVANNFEHSRSSLHAIGEICRRLDGIPLAIELAAARAATLGIDGICQRLDNRLAVLTGGFRTALPRHQTLRATFDWSFDLLDPPSRRLFRRLAVFSGMFSLEAICHVTCDADLSINQVIDGIAELVNKSMMVMEVDSAVAQYRLPESTRAYAAEKLDAEGETQRIATRNAHYQLSRLRPLTEHLADVHSELQHALDDTRHAVDWAFSATGDPRLGIKLTANLVFILIRQCRLDECARRASLAVNAIDPLPPGTVDCIDEIRIRSALASVMPNLDGPISRASELWHRVLALSKECGSDEFEARAYWGLWNTAMSSGHVYEALNWSSRFHAFAGCRGTSWQCTLAQQLAATSQHCLGKHAEARDTLNATLEIFASDPKQVIDIQGFAVAPLAITYSGLARILWLEGDSTGAMAYADKAVDVIDPATMEPWLTHVLAVVAAPLALLSGDYQRCRRYLSIMRSQTTLHRFTIWHDYGECLAGYLAIIEGDKAGGLATLEASLAALAAAGFRRLTTPLIVACAEAQIAAGRIVEAKAALTDILHFDEENGALFFLPEVWRALGLAAYAEAREMPNQHDNESRRDKLAHAEACYRQSLKMASEQGATMWEVRTTIAQARFWMKQNRAAEAKSALAGLATRISPDCNARDVRVLFSLLNAVETLTA